MEGKARGFENDGMLDDQGKVSSRGDRDKDDEDTRSERSRHVVTLFESNGLTVNKLGPGVDKMDYPLRSTHGTPTCSRSAQRSRRPSGSYLSDFQIGELERPKDEKDYVAENNIFSRRMTIAGGFLDIALFTSNCEQLKSILEIKDVHKHYELVLSLLIISMVLQAACGLTLFLVGCHTIKNPEDKKRGEIFNHITIGLIALITVVNVFISSFTVKGEVLQRCYNCLMNNEPQNTN